MVDVEHLTKYYGDKKVLDDISFSIADRQVVGLLGLNGAGKSTIMNILTGYLAATSGTVRIAGYDILSDATNAKKHIGYLPELFSFYPEMRVNDFLSFICDLKGVMRDHKERETHLSDICERVGLADERRRMIRIFPKDIGSVSVLRRLSSAIQHFSYSMNRRQVLTRRKSSICGS